VKIRRSKLYTLRAKNLKGDWTCVFPYELHITHMCQKLYYHEMFRPEKGHCQVGNIKLEISMKLKKT